jgi:hypothetical protein
MLVRLHLCAHCTSRFVAQEGAPEKPPAARAALARSIEEGLRHEKVVPDIFRFQQTVWMHTGERMYHPGNRRVVLRVAARDLQARYGLSEDALQHALQVRVRQSPHPMFAPLTLPAINGAGSACAAAPCCVCCTAAPQRARPESRPLHQAMRQPAVCCRPYIAQP